MEVLTGRRPGTTSGAPPCSRPRLIGHTTTVAIPPAPGGSRGSRREAARHRRPPPREAQPCALKLKPKGDHSPLGNEKLANERTVTRWGHTNLLGGITEEPSMSVKSIGKLRWEHRGQPARGLSRARVARMTTACASGSRSASRGGPTATRACHAKESRSPTSRSSPHTSPSTARSQGDAAQGRQGRRFSPVGVGPAGTATPSGKFWIRERLKNLGAARPTARGRSAPAYSADADRLDGGGGVVGIHGTNQPGADPRPTVARVRPCPERQDLAAREDHADRHADQIK